MRLSRQTITTGALAAAAALALAAPASAAPAAPTDLRLKIDPVGIDLVYLFSWGNSDPDLPAVELSIDGAPFAAAPYAAAGVPGVPGGVVLQDSDTHFSAPGSHTLQVRFVGADGSASAPATYRWTTSPADRRALKIKAKRVRRGVFKLKTRAGARSYRWELSGRTVCEKASCTVRIGGGWHKLRLTVIDDGPRAIVKQLGVQGR